MLAVAYGASLLYAWSLLFQADDRWLGTLVMYGPRWVWSLPMAVLVPLSAWRAWHAWPVLLVDLLLLVGPVMELQVPAPRHWRPQPTIGTPLRMVTCNTDGKRLDVAALDEFLEETRPDVVVLQEFDEVNMRVARRGPDWYARRVEEHVVSTRFPILWAEEVAAPDGMHPPGVRFRLQSPFGPLDVFSVHLESPRGALTEVLFGENGRQRIEENAEMRREQTALVSMPAQGSLVPVLVGGDFNTGYESAIYAQYWSAFTNAFTEAGWGFGRTHRTRKTAVRIDHVLAGPGFRVRACSVGPNVRSEHRPVVAELDWVGDGRP
jgi:endonuclease/exonuclease/phosphatase family metal-dependent hydrolase